MKAAATAAWNMACPKACMRFSKGDVFHAMSGQQKPTCYGRANILSLHIGLSPTMAEP